MTIQLKFIKYKFLLIPFIAYDELSYLNLLSIENKSGETGICENIINVSCLSN